MNKEQALVTLSEAAREQALARFHILQPFLMDQVPLSEIGRIHGVPLRTLQRWATSYQRKGLAGLARKGRADRGQRHLEPELQRLISQGKPPALPGRRAEFDKSGSHVDPAQS